MCKPVLVAPWIRFHSNEHLRIAAKRPHHDLFHLELGWKMQIK